MGTHEVAAGHVVGLVAPLTNEIKFAWHIFRAPFCPGTPRLLAEVKRKLATIVTLPHRGDPGITVMFTVASQKFLAKGFLACDCFGTFQMQVGEVAQVLGAGLWASGCVGRLLFGVGSLVSLIGVGGGGFGELFLASR